MKGGYVEECLTRRRAAILRSSRCLESCMEGFPVFAS